MEMLLQEEIPFVNTKLNTFIRRSINDKMLVVSQLEKTKQNTKNHYYFISPCVF